MRMILVARSTKSRAPHVRNETKPLRAWDFLSAFGNRVFQQNRPIADDGVFPSLRSYDGVTGAWRTAPKRWPLPWDVCDAVMEMGAVRDPLRDTWHRLRLSIMSISR